MRNSESVTSKRREKFRFSSLNRHVLSADIHITDSCHIRLKRSEARHDEEQYKEFDLNNNVLPPNDLYERPQPLSSRTDMVAALLMAIDAFLIRTDASPTRTERVTFFIHDIVMFFEALWLNNVTTVEGMTRSQFQNLLGPLVRGGWTETLHIAERADAAGILVTECSMAYANRTLMARISTNYCFVARFLRRRVAQDNKESATSTNVTNYSASTIRHRLAAANLLYDARREFGLKECPFPDAYAQAQNAGRAPGRTKNLGALAAGALFRVSMIWLYERGPVIINLLNEMATAVERHAKRSGRAIGQRASDAFLQSDNLKRLNELLPYQIYALDVMHGVNVRHSFRSTITSLLASCFVLVAFMNARRKCEVTDRKVGLMSGALNVVHESLQIYTVSFYLAKSYRRRMPFYVNQTTADAIRTLESLQNCFIRIDEIMGRTSEVAVDEISLFSYRRFSTGYGVGKRSIWFDFQSYETSAGETSIVIEATGAIDGIGSTRTHVFRRMYALNFFYRYENADILALTQQFGDVDLNSVRAYVTDPVSRSDMECIEASMPTEIDDRRRAFLDEMREIERDVRVVGEEKLAEEIYAVLAGERFAGGYAAYVRRVHARFARTVTFSGAKAGDAVVESMKRRGHFPRPFVHGECMLGTVTNIRHAHCFSADTARVHRENASVKTCVGCRFHLTKVEYVRSLQVERERLQQKLLIDSTTPFELHRKSRELADLDEAIALLCQRLQVDPNA